MLANWLIAGLASGRVTTKYPHHREQMLSPFNWDSIPKLNKPCPSASCTLCIQICPTSAIKWIEMDKSSDVGSSIELDGGACITCGRCVKQCPEHVFVWDSAIDRSEIKKENLFSSERVGDRK